MVKKTLLGVVVLCFLVAGFGCATMPPAKALSYPGLKPVPPPSPGHGIKIDNLVVISDISRSMADYGKVGTEKALLSSFNQGIPEGLKNAGMRTFGRSAYYHTVLVQPVEKYDRALLAGLIGDLKAGTGNTPLATALDKALLDLEETKGSIAVLIVSDGENVTRDPIPPALALAEQYGKRICVYAVHIGSSPAGREKLENIVNHIGCGRALAAEELASEDAMSAFIAEVFYGKVVRDSDGDGVYDPSDKCPGTPKGVKVDKTGCPIVVDSDGDGVPDDKDKCPGTPKGVKVDKVGCPLDSDGDGVVDYQDKCPDTPKGAPVNAVGCWIVEGINFDYDKADIKPRYHDRLNTAVRILQKNPTMKIEIQGHTDSKGSDAYNQALSERRADSVKNYIVSAGVDSARVSMRGLGEKKPIASNDTPEGRAQNRRIEIKILER